MNDPHILFFNMIYVMDNIFSGWVDFELDKLYNCSSSANLSNQARIAKDPGGLSEKYGIMDEWIKEEEEKDEKEEEEARACNSISLSYSVA